MNSLSHNIKLKKIKDLLIGKNITYQLWQDVNKGIINDIDHRGIIHVNRTRIVPEQDKYEVFHNELKILIPQDYIDFLVQMRNTHDNSSKYDELLNMGLFNDKVIEILNKYHCEFKFDGYSIETKFGLLNITLQNNLHNNIHFIHMKFQEPQKLKFENYKVLGINYILDIFNSYDIQSENEIDALNELEDNLINLTIDFKNQLLQVNP